jgi:hypothetical protein
MAPFVADADKPRIRTDTPSHQERPHRRRSYVTTVSAVVGSLMLASSLSWVTSRHDTTGAWLIIVLLPLVALLASLSEYSRKRS